MLMDRAPTAQCGRWKLESMEDEEDEEGGRSKKQKEQQKSRQEGTTNDYEERGSIYTCTFYEE